jgi:NAD(P)-dependent dehydrogenase (short-subunit alcohol dehydrogenase family)
VSLDKFRLDDRVALVTGGSKGLGRAMAKALAGAGADVVVTSRHLDEGELVAAEIHQLGRRALALKADMRDPQAITEMVRRTEADFGKIDILVNNAGTGRVTPALEVTESEWDKIHATNLKGPLLATQAVARGMVERKFGRIINVGSVASLTAFPGLSSYVASKHGLLGLTRAFALELAPFGVTVNCLCPGFFVTDLTQDVKADPAMDQAIVDRIPEGRWGQPEDLDTAVLFLASPASSFVTGIALCVDGGWTVQ